MRQLSFAFLEAGRHIARHASNLASIPDGSGSGAVVLRKVDAGRNMARFYSLEVERDLLGKVVLVRRWGRIGTSGKTRLDEHAGEGEAMAALHALETAKHRRGYWPTDTHRASP
jgi:predicted DNA-binding WGR domain protein